METTTAPAGRAARTRPGPAPSGYATAALVALAGLAAVGPLLMLRLAVAGNHPWLERLAATGHLPLGEGGLLVPLGGLAFLAAAILAVVAFMRLSEAEAGEP